MLTRCMERDALSAMVNPLSRLSFIFLFPASRAFETSIDIHMSIALLEHRIKSRLFCPLVAAVVIRRIRCCPWRIAVGYRFLKQRPALKPLNTRLLLFLATKLVPASARNMDAQ